MFRYKIKSTGNNSKKYGNCEVCNQPCSEVFIQLKQKSYQMDFRTGWTEVGSLFGHKECLERVREVEET